MEIPLTKLREFYNFLHLFSTDTHIKILEDFNRKENYKRLIDIFQDSKKHFSKYCCYDNFKGDNIRKTLPPNPKSISNTNEMVSILENIKNNKIKGFPNLKFDYINREISPLRTTGRIIFENGKSGKSSGLGGIDFIGWNTENKLPVLGEIKVGNDKNPFYAIIQLLTYLSELSTKNQIKRINYTELFPSKITVKNSFYLYILLSNYNLNSDKRSTLLKESKVLVKNIVSGIKEIKDIVFLKKDNPKDDIELI